MPIHSRPPNLLFLDCHDLGDWLGCYGRPYLRTPHLDALAAEGALFRQCIASAPICMPSRAGLYTGRMPHCTGVTGQFPLNEGERCLPLLLAQRGYETVLAGGLNILNDPGWMGFERAIPAGKDPAREEAAAAFLAGLHSRRERPFLLFVSFGDVHRPYGNDYDTGLAETIEVPPYLPDIPLVRRDLAALCRRVELLDAKVGRVLEALRATGLEGNTIVVFTTDHGPALARAKHTLYDAGLRVALLVKYPPLIPAGARCEHLLSNLDLAPTLLEMAGLPAPEGVHGRSFASELTGFPRPARSQVRSEVFSEHNWGRRAGLAYYSPARSLRSERYKYIRNYAETPFYVDTDWLARFGAERGLVEELWGQPAPREELYDLRADPYELHNLATDPAHAEICRELGRRLDAFLSETDDPILHGPVPHREGKPDVPLWLPRGDGRYRLRDYDPREGSDRPC